MHQRGNERDLQLDLLATQRRRGGQCRDLIESATRWRINSAFLKPVFLKDAPGDWSIRRLIS
jgi:hypothetical protein